MFGWKCDLTPFSKFDLTPFSDGPTRAPRGAAAFELDELVGDQRPHGQLRQRRLVALRILALGDALPPGLEGREHRFGLGEPLLEQRLAEESRVAAMAATE